MIITKRTLPRRTFLRGAGACIALVAFAFALVNYAIDELTNPRLRAQRERTGILKRLPFGRASSRSTPVVNHAG